MKQRKEGEEMRALKAPAGGKVRVLPNEHVAECKKWKPRSK